ncbi:hypothetical protein PPERSA_12033 [Pseudocohnilembus persalinus]|uniref:2-oxoisovalerate dehydrogenase subunit alpha n=1 Tax=Pseudocohnilembus persalinus TaxID=266149 RepID=A0A0V0R8T1_PSEPJ|nr:hypothetical protein PPERSA_12033 [Pseudocohnilembus persalinus]|eukprot:KRX10909.1 hypothetical protein PPERSA_12033 [Pseudocohnilembus persalinus]
MQKKIVQNLARNQQFVKTFSQVKKSNSKNLISEQIQKFNFCYVKHNKPFNESEYNYVTEITPRMENPKVETFRVYDLKGKVVAPKYEKVVDDKTLNKIYETMIRVEEMDTILNMSQRQGKISFYMPSFGELASTIGSSAALKDDDLQFSQYREQGALIWRGYTIEEMINQCMGNGKDEQKGRQMPVHYGSRKLSWMTVSSPLTTQVPQASGAGYAYRQQGLDRVAVAWCGEGAASEGDFHSALNFAATLESQTLFLLRNNKYAISTPDTDQFRGDAIAGKAVGYGIQTYRVDGNDVLAVIATVKAAREYIIKNKKPAFVELMTYRISDHSTSDHSVLYRHEEELESWRVHNNPINRLGLYLQQSGRRNINKEEDDKIRKDVKNEVISTLKKAQQEKLYHWDTLFDDVYDELTPNLKEQKKQLNDHLEKYGDKYKLEKFQPY